MSYSTGEIAELCGVTVRTVQYYDGEGLLKPEGFSEGGRRLYGENGLKTLQVICTYKNLGLKLSDIKRILSDEANSRKILLSVLEEREKTLDEEINRNLVQRGSIRAIKASIEQGKAIPPESFGDVQTIMQGKNRLRRLRLITGLVGGLSTAAEITVIVLWAVLGLWIPFAVTIPVVFVVCAVMTAAYYKAVSYVCVDCGKEFKPEFKSFFISRHTPNTRYLKCPCCGSKNYHTETYSD